MLGKIVVGEQDIEWHDPNTRNLVAEASCNEPYMVTPPGGGDIDILAVDCGMKTNILRELASRGANIKVVPWNWDVTKEEYDGLFYSNGPGNPTMASETVK